MRREAEIYLVQSAGCKWGTPAAPFRFSNGEAPEKFSVVLYFIVVALLLLHTMFWGVGLSWLVLPRVWRPAWWVLAPVFGFALQSAVVWAGAHTTLAGTNVYAGGSEVLPLGLLAFAAWRLGRAGLRRRLTEFVRAWPVLVLLAAAGLLLLWPMAQRGAWTLTSSSLGSCDHADYAAGARVFRDFARNSDEGFLGLAEVASVGSTEGFFEFWLKLNHFTPSALLAHHAAILQLPTYQLVSVSAVAVLLATTPLVLLLARLVGLRGWQRIAVAALYAFSPLSAYAVHQGALGQLYGAHGIAALTLATIGCARFGAARSEMWRWGAVALAAFWLLAGAYNFILTVALAPAAGWLLLQAVRERRVHAWPRVAVALGAAFVVSVLLFWGRYAGVVERFRLFEEFNFGWPVPRLWPAAWLGFVADPQLHGWSRPWTAIASGVVIAAWVAGVVTLVRRRAMGAVAAAAFVLPVAAGWALLMWESRTRANASYDAFKILSVFLPGLLAGLCAWLAGARGAATKWIAVACVVAVLAGNIVAGVGFARVMARPPLRVERTLIDLRRIEKMERVESLNMRIDNFWARLWANYFLLRKPQYFATHTYEGRLNTTLKGSWDLSDSMLHSIPRRSADYVALNEQFHLERVGAPGRVQLEFSDGWHPMEIAGINRWRWGAGEARIRVTNPDTRPVRVALRLNARSTGDNVLRVSVGTVEVARGPLTASFRQLDLRDISLPPGTSELVFAVERPATTVAGDTRVLGFALAQLTVIATPSSR
jgi:hypothetical protein